MQNKYEKYLPIGSVVILKEAKKRIMIIGYCPMKADKDNTENREVFDYSGCLYPEGFIASDRVLLFNHSQIERIYCIGYSDDEQKQFSVNLKNILKELETNKAAE